jgi:GLPGLI family protein
MGKFILSLILLCIANLSQGIAQSVNFEGEIHFTITYTYFPDHLKRFQDQLPRNSDVYVRNNLVCKKGPTGMVNGYQIYIKNLATHTGYNAMQVGETSVAYRLTAQDYQTELNSMTAPVSIEYLNETKQIAGYLCKKALVYMPSSTQPFTVYYTDKIPAEAYVIYKGLKGFPLYFEGNMNGVTYYSQAFAINPTQQSDAQFLLPKNYKLLSKEEYRNALIKDIPNQQ